MRLIGSIAALLLCILFGKSKAAELDMRQRIMHNFALDMRALAAEMQYRPRDIKDIAQMLSEGALGEFWREFMLNVSKGTGAEQAWEQAAKTCGEFHILSMQEMALIAESGRSIGIMNAEDNAKMLKDRSEQAETYAAELKTQSKSKGAIYQKLGMLGGLAIMLLIA
ncbi:MAG: stage III sporulation protein AB [Clostridia bacterium]|nr:stage III sporulation protein AB [Clostridia bacterium]